MSGFKDLSKNLISDVARIMAEAKKPKLDPVGKEDADIDNDGKANTKSDKYLIHRRQVRSAAIHEAKPALDPVGKEDADIDNDGKPNDENDKYIRNRRRAIAKAMMQKQNEEVDVAENTVRITLGPAKPITGKEPMSTFSGGNTRTPPPTRAPQIDKPIPKNQRPAPAPTPPSMRPNSAMRNEPITGGPDTVPMTPERRQFLKDLARRNPTYREEVEIAEAMDAKDRFKHHHDTARALLKSIGEHLKTEHDEAHKHVNFRGEKGPTWGHVGSMEHVSKQLGDIHDMLARTGEYKMNEEVESVLTQEEILALDEISKKKAEKYIDAAMDTNSEKSVSNLASKGGFEQGERGDEDSSAGEEEDAKSVKRSKMVMLAAKKLSGSAKVPATNEEKDIDPDLEDELKATRQTKKSIEDAKKKYGMKEEVEEVDENVISAVGKYLSNLAARAPGTPVYGMPGRAPQSRTPAPAPQSTPSGTKANTTGMATKTVSTSTPATKTVDLRPANAPKYVKLNPMEEEIELEEDNSAERQKIEVTPRGKFQSLANAARGVMTRQQAIQKQVIDEAKRGRPKKNAVAADEKEETKALGMQLRKAASMGKPVTFDNGEEADILPRHIEMFNDHMDARKTSQDKFAFQKKASASHDAFKKAVVEPLPNDQKGGGEIVKYRH